MVLGIVEALAASYFPSQYLFQIAVTVVTVLALRAFSQGRTTNRDRDLHARIILITGGFTPLGLTILQSLAQRGAHIITLSPDPIDSEKVTILINLLRSTTSNEQIFAEECDLSSPTSIRSFCTKFLTGKEQRLDAIIFAHEHRHIGTPAIFSRVPKEQFERERESGSLSTFLITTLLLPALLVAPAERDIRIINVVNPFYAAAAGQPISPAFQSSDRLSSKSILLREGIRSLRTIIFTRHLQRVLDALPIAGQLPKAEEGSTAVPIISAKVQKSNIVAISASPGIGRVDTVASYFNANLMSPSGSYLGLFIYILIQPILRIITKSPTMAMQTLLHVLFLPTPFKILSATTVNPSTKIVQGPLDDFALEMPEEVLLPGTLYADCAAVKLKVSLPKELVEKDVEFQRENAKSNHDKEGDKGKSKASSSLKKEALDIEDDGQYGGELAGRVVWESLEEALKLWEKENQVHQEKEKNP